MKLPFPRFQFSLRTMFVIVTLIAIFCGYEVNWIRQRNEFLKREGVHSLKNKWNARGLPLGLRIFGEQGYLVISMPDASTELEMDAKSLFPEADFDPDGHTIRFNDDRNFLIPNMEDSSDFEPVEKIFKSIRHGNPPVRPPSSEEPRLP